MIVMRVAESSAPPRSPFEEIVAAHEVEIYRYLRRLAPSAEDAADLHQETFLRAFRAYARLADDANVRAWLYRIAGNLARDAHRRRAVRIAVSVGSLDCDAHAAGADTRAIRDHEFLVGGPVRAPGGDPVYLLEVAELRDAVRAALLQLTERQRVAVVRRVLEGRAYPDVAGALACSDATARQHVSQGLRRLRALLAAWVEVDR